MQDPADFEIQKTDDQPLEPVPEPRSVGPWIIAAVVLGLVAGAAWFFITSRPERPSEESAAETAAPSDAEIGPLGAAADPIEVPPLDESDALVRSLVRALSSHPRVVAWLATDNLIRNFTVAVENIANGAVPSQSLRVLRPSGRFEVLDTDEMLVIDPQSYERYNAVADAVGSVDADGAARLYTTLKPRIEEAYQELGREQPFDRTLEQAIVSLLQVPVLEGDVHLVPEGGVFAFEDPAVQRLTLAQRQLVRMGPRNVRIIQAKLREIGLALGIPHERLPGA